VLSANLFAWFLPAGSIVVVLVAIASRTFIRRNGHHLFNPSAAGLTVAGLLSFFSPNFAFDGVFHTLSLAPNMAELLILLALIPQTRFRIVLASVGAILGMKWFGLIWAAGPNLGTPGTLLTIALFATDPATMPRTPVGQLLFGAVVGFGVVLFSAVLTLAGLPDDFAKVFPVPIANLLVGRFDSVGGRLAARAPSFLSPRWNLAHVMVWLILVVPPVARFKPPQFLIAPHWTYATPLVVGSRDGVPHCDANAVFCQPFSFAQELRRWID
jgi:hypothetical protein